jgi:hypothetical protein
MVIPSGACWPGVTTASAAPVALFTPAATSIPSTPISSLKDKG